MSEDDWKVPLMDGIFNPNTITVTLLYEPMQCNANTTLGDECPRDIDGKCCAIREDVVEAIGDPNEKTSAPVSPYMSAKLTLTVSMNHTIFSDQLVASTFISGCAQLLASYSFYVEYATGAKPLFHI
ncbi:unnamed protein product [Cylicostephanus goldi]|uniref:Uncharacterized protein n=1 Tax=Cylicostephanus goldi TaxID=71465 RepID=A0A3P6PQE0_CYLGO|nr:unnamed protein product [Cylicostephanus goldi]